jgi:N6-L-threonylcarbamoyladenine synthase
MDVTILGIESSCDDTAVAIVQNGILLSSVVNSQEIHQKYGGVVPELASRAHQQNIIPVVHEAIRLSGLEPDQISAVAFTRGPGLLGSLLVGASFAKGFALSRQIPIIEINHLQAHVLVHFIREKNKKYSPPGFPFLCLLVSGGHTQILLVKDYLEMEVLGTTIDDAAGEAFDKCAKVMGLPYPGGPVIDQLAVNGNEQAFKFAKPQVAGLDFSFSGLKTSFLYFLRDQGGDQKEFISKNLSGLCASLQRTIVEILLEKTARAVDLTGVKQIALAGGVSANSRLKKAFLESGKKSGWKIFIPETRFTSDNAAMIAINGFYKFQKGIFADHKISPSARYEI